MCSYDGEMIFICKTMNTKRLYLFNIISRLLPYSRFFEFRAKVLRWCGAVVGKDVRIYGGVEVIGNGRLVVGNDVFIGLETRIITSGEASVTIGNKVDIAPQVMILTGTHEVDAAVIEGVTNGHVAGNGVNKSVKIGNGCWICARAMILPGVDIADNSLVAAGSVVVQSPGKSGMRIGGVPARELNSSK